MNFEFPTPRFLFIIRHRDPVSDIENKLEFN